MRRATRRAQAHGVEADPVLIQVRSERMHDRINIAIVGLGFGAEFIPIYQRHPRANLYAICQRTESRLQEIGDAFGIAKRYASSMS